MQGVGMSGCGGGCRGMCKCVCLSMCGGEESRVRVQDVSCGHCF